MNGNKKLFKDSERVKQRYATRKLKIGMVSLLMGFTFIFAASSKTVERFVPQIVNLVSASAQEVDGIDYLEVFQPQHKWDNSLNWRSGNMFAKDSNGVRPYTCSAELSEDGKK